MRYCDVCMCLNVCIKYANISFIFHHCTVLLALRVRIRISILCAFCHGQNDSHHRYRCKKKQHNTITNELSIKHHAFLYTMERAHIHAFSFPLHCLPVSCSRLEGFILFFFPSFLLLKIMMVGYLYCIRACVCVCIVWPDSISCKS